MASVKDDNINETAVSDPQNAVSGSANDNPTDAGIPSDKIAKITRTSSITMVMVGGLALFSDGYNAQIIGYMNPLFSELYPDGFSASIKTRLSNAYLIGEIFGMLFFGWAIDKLGRRTGILFATIFLVLGIVLATAAHGKDNLGMFWMMIVSRGIAGFGAGGEFFLGIIWLRGLTCTHTRRVSYLRDR
jgi:MFS family permease